MDTKIGIDGEELDVPLSYSHCLLAHFFFSFSLVDFLLLFLIYYFVAGFISLYYY